MVVNDCKVLAEVEEVKLIKTMLALTGRVLLLLKEAATSTEAEGERDTMWRKFTDNHHRLSLAVRESVNALNTDESNCKWHQRAYMPTQCEAGSQAVPRS